MTTTNGIELRKSVERALTLLSASSNIKVHPPLRESWGIGLKEVPDNMIDLGIEKVLQEGTGTGKKMPTPWEFRDICRSIRKDKLSSIRKDQEIKDYQTPDHGKVAKVKEKASELIERLESKDESELKLEKPTLLIYEYVNLISGKLEELRHYGSHSDSDFFREECIKFSKKPPLRIVHRYTIFKKLANKDEKGNIKRTFMGTVFCNEGYDGANPTTVAYYH